MIDHFELNGEPRGKQRPRVANGHAYTPQQTREYEDELRWAWRTCSHLIRFQGYVQMKVIAWYGIPKSARKTDKERMYLGEIRPTRKPDVDNILKIVADALNGLAYEDDKQINAVMVEKRYAITPSVDVWLTDEGLQAIDV